MTCPRGDVYDFDVLFFLLPTSRQFLNWLVHPIRNQGIVVCYVSEDLHVYTNAHTQPQPEGGDGLEEGDGEGLPVAVRLFFIWSRDVFRF